MAQLAKVKIDSISALAELDRVGWEYEPVGDDEVKLKCPVHEAEGEHTPSVSLNVSKNLWQCKAASCNAAGDIVSLLAYILRCERRTMVEDLSKRYDLGVIKTFNPEIIERYHDAIWESGPLIKALRDRAVTDEDIRRARLGYHDGRIIIPIFDDQARIINIRKYLPGAPGPQKMYNAKGYSGVDLFQVDQMKYGIIWICAGEMKALVASRILNPHGVGAVAPTCGEGGWNPALNARFKDKLAYVAMDVDAGGKVAARKVAAEVCFDARATKIIRLPLDRDKYPKGDINDWVAKEGAKFEDFDEAMRVAERFTLDAQPEETRPEEINEVKLINSTDSCNLGRRIKVNAVVQAMDTTPYIVPREVGVACAKDQPNCSHCPVKPRDPDETTGKVTLTIKGTSAGMLEMVNAHKKFQKEAMREALLIPPCKTVTFTIRNHYNVVDARLTPQLHYSGDNREHIIQPAYIVGDGDLELDLNLPFEFKGRVYPHPKNQQAILLLDEKQQADDALDSFELGQEDVEQLKIFRPEEWTVESIGKKLDEVYEDYEANVTRVFYRRDMHLAMDLAYHSVLYFNFDGRQEKGWVELLVTGDSSQAKSECSSRLMDHLGLGSRQDCKNATKAGLLGGTSQLGNRWFVQWGTLVINDRGLVLMEEIKGMPIEVMAQLTDLRSSGIAHITSIGGDRRAYARTRKIMISNPRDDRAVSQYNFGIEVIKTLIGSLEDIRRFDLAIILSNKQIDPKALNKLSKERPDVKHVYTKEKCRKRCLLAWTRNTEEVIFEPDAVEACLSKATELCGQFTEQIPLVDRGTMRYKLARLAASLAVMTLSTVSDLQPTIVVRKCHVEYIAKFLHDQYASPTFGYADFSRAQEFASKVIDPAVVRTHIIETRHPKDLVEHLLHADEISHVDLCDWCEVDRDAGQKILSLLVRKHALYRIKRWYVKTSEFIELLKEMKLKGLPDKPEIAANAKREEKY